jgi:hypothetical protein
MAKTGASTEETKAAIDKRLHNRAKVVEDYTKRILDMATVRGLRPSEMYGSLIFALAGLGDYFPSTSFDEFKKQINEDLDALHKQIRLNKEQVEGKA